MDWNTLLAVVIGGLIATIGSILNNRFQSREKDKDRIEQRREAKIKAREKWMERDILAIMDLVEKLMALLSYPDNLQSSLDLLDAGQKSRVLSETEFLERKKGILDRVYDTHVEFHQVTDSISRLVSSFEAEWGSSGWSALIDSSTKLKHAQMECYGKPQDEQDKSKIYSMWYETVVNAGKFHQALREKLISIRE